MTLKLAEAKRIIDGAIATARELKVEVSVAVCNHEGRLVALNRMDGIPFVECSRQAIGKAIASATLGVPSNRPEAWIDHPITNIVIGEGAPVCRRAGGLPIIRDNVIEGACGVSGTNNDLQDDECARAGLAAL
jgi:uncharacterized protein GlcG (DUF336 family)